MSKQIKDHYVFTSFELSKQLNQLQSFKDYCANYHDYYYNQIGNVIDAETSTLLETECPAITQSHAQKFFRDVYNIIVEPLFDETQSDGFSWLIGSIYYNNIDIINEQHKSFGDYYDNYEETLEKGLIEAFKLINE